MPLKGMLHKSVLLKAKVVIMNVGDVQVEFRDKETVELMCEKNRDLNQKRWVNRCYLKIIGRLTAYATLNLLWVNNYW